MYAVRLSFYNFLQEIFHTRVSVRFKRQDERHAAIDPSKHTRAINHVFWTSLPACNVRVLTRKLIRQRGNRDARSHAPPI